MKIKDSMGIMKRKTQIVRVDREVWGKCRNLFPNEDAASISRILYNTSLIKIESHLKDKNFIDKFGTFLYGNVWTKPNKK